MYKFNKVCSFHVSRIETEAIKVLRENEINISRFLRGELRKMADQFQLQNEKNENKVKGGSKL